MLDVEHHTIALLLHEAGRVGYDAVIEGDAVDGTLRAICAATGSPLAFAHVFEPDGTLSTRVGVNIDGTPIDCSPTHDARCPEHRAARVDRILRAGHVAGLDDPPVLCAETSGDVMRVGVPLAAGKTTLGAIEVLLPPGAHLSDAMRSALTDAGAHLTRAIERIRLEVDAASAEVAVARWAARAAHELRTPVAAASLALSTLDTRDSRLDDDDRRMLLEAVDRSVAQLKGLVSRLTDLAQTHTDTATDIRAVRLDGALRDIAADITLATGRTVDLLVVDEPVAMVDEIALTQIVTNLLQNAIRHGGPSIWLSAATKDDRIVVTVADDGDGVPAAVAEHLFEPFVRGERRDGFGLGLAISRTLAQSCRGDLVHEPVSPHGARFVLTLPAAPS